MTMTTTTLVRRLTDLSMDLLELADRKRPGDDTRTLRAAGRQTRCAAYLVDHQVYDAETGYAWLRAARAFHEVEQRRNA